MQLLNSVMETIKKLCNPSKEGITHINIYSKAKTELGLLLTNFARTPINHPEFGHFESLEGLWYWLGTGKRHDVLRTLYGYKAKQIGKSFERINNPDFQKEFESGLEVKFRSHPRIAELFKNTSVPLVHYYWFGTIDNYRLVIPTGSDWFTKWWQDKHLSFTDDRTRLWKQTENKFEKME